MFPDVAEGADGGYLVIWNGTSGTPQGGDWQLFGRRLDALGQPLLTFDTQLTRVAGQKMIMSFDNPPVVTFDPRSGGFLLLWASWIGGNATQPRTARVFAQSVGADGRPIGEHQLMLGNQEMGASQPALAWSANTKGFYIAVRAFGLPQQPGSEDMEIVGRLGLPKK
jgi:hypothetical protein